jgi:hypothetical protein
MVFYASVLHCAAGSAESWASNAVLDRTIQCTPIARGIVGVGPSGGGFDVLADNSGMSGGNPQQRNGWTLWFSSALLPIPERGHTDFHCLCELRLTKTDKSPQGRDVVTRLELSLHETSSNARGNRPRKLFFRQFGDIGHCFCPM